MRSSLRLLSGSNFLARQTAFFRRVAFNSRRGLALSGVLLAFSIEFCGCSPVRDCALVRHTPVSSLPWTEMLQQCSQCLSAGELAILVRQRQDEEERSVGLGAAATVPSDRTVEQLLRGDPELSFDDGPPSRNAGSRQPLIGRGTATGASAAAGQHPILWAIPESVFYVYKHLAEGDETARRPPSATGFIVSVAGPHGAVIRFLVTARHVVDPEWASCAEQDPAAIDVRLNRRSGGVGYETIALRSGRDRLFLTPSDPAADLAIIPLDHELSSRIEAYQFRDTPFRLLPSGPDQQLFHAGMPAITARVAAGPADGPDGYPVFDAGTLATMPDGSIHVQCGAQDSPDGKGQSRAKALHVWFIDAGVSAGVSGAPVYTAVARAGDSVQVPLLLGVQSVTWPDKGVAGITPATVLADLIRSALNQADPGHEPGHASRHPPGHARQEDLASLY